MVSNIGRFSQSVSGLVFTAPRQYNHLLEQNGMRERERDKESLFTVSMTNSNNGRLPERNNHYSWPPPDNNYEQY